MSTNNDKKQNHTPKPPLSIEIGGKQATSDSEQPDGACYKIGKLGKPHGVKGEITFMFEDDVFDRVDADFLALDIDGILVPFFMEEYRFRSNESALVKFCDVDTQERARQLTGCNVYFPRYMADDRTEDISWAAIVNFEIVDSESDKVVGEILSVDDSTLNILFEVRTSDGKVLLIPASEELIRNVDTKKRQISVELPQGILDLD